LPTHEAARPCWQQGVRLGFGIGFEMHGTFSGVCGFVFMKNDGQ